MNSPALPVAYIIDSKAKDRKAVARHLHTRGYNTREFENADTALQEILVAEVKPTVVCTELDIRGATTTGMDILLKTEGLGIAVIAVTKLFTEAAIKEVISKDAGFVSKNAMSDEAFAAAIEDASVCARDTQARIARQESLLNRIAFTSRIMR